MDKYGIIFQGVTDEGKMFHIQQNTGHQKKVIIRVYNDYFDYPEVTRELIMESGISYWNYVLHNNSHRYVLIRDSQSLEIVGMFGLDGYFNFNEFDYNNYAKKIFNLLPENGKGNVLSVFNEIVCHRVYHNDFIDVEENDVVVDIGFNYGLFSTISQTKKPKRIIGFEPNFKICKVFNENYGGDKIELYNYAVSNVDSKVTFYENGDIPVSTIKEELFKQYRVGSYEVDAININTLVKTFDLEKIDYLKVDCEGSEFDIFDELLFDYLKQNIRKIAIEFHDYLHSENVQKVLTKLTNCNFQIKIKNDEGGPLGMIYAKK